MKLNIKTIKKGKRKKYFSIGVDEAGRGPLAGPVVACAILGVRNKGGIKNKELKEAIKGLKSLDSKKLSPKRREIIFEALKKSDEFHWSVSKVSEKVIDKVNILKATKLAMERAVNNLAKKEKIKPKLVMIDGNFSIKISFPQRSFIKGDQKVFLISLASIIAKVSRDKIMGKMDKKYPGYGFAKHKGYGTRSHFLAISKYGLSPIHRKSFRIKRFDNKN